jgi:hypothetical protein
MSSTLPPKTVNGDLNSVFNVSDFVATTDGKNDAKYLKLTGGTLSGGLTTPSLSVNNAITTNGITSSSGTNQFNTNITLPTTYSISPNLSLPLETQLGGYLSVAGGVSPTITATTGTVSVICSLVLTPGVWLCNWRGSILPTVSGTGTYSNIRLAFTPANGTIDHVGDVQQRVAIASSQTCTVGATNGYDVSLIGSTIVRPTASITYYLNAASVFTSTNASRWRGHIHAVRIA